MTSVAPAGEGGGGGGGSEGTTNANTTTITTSTTATATATAAKTAASTTTEHAPSPATPPAQQSTTQALQHPPPSPLSGCYLLVVLPEPHTAQHKDLILNRLAKGFLSWDKDSCHVDLEKELQALVTQSPEGEEARNGERLIQYATENLVTEVLIYPQSNTLLQCIRNLLASFTKHRHIIHAGYTFGGNGSWILQDGTFSLADFLDAFSEHEVQRVLRAYENSVTVDIHCAGVGDWTTSRLSKEACTRACRVRVNPDDVLTAGVPAITSFVNYIGQYLIPQTLDQLMEPSDVVGNIRFTHPTLYVFPGGQGDAALFGINGFNMLVDGGFARKACFWDFVRHLDRLDAVLVTRINNSNVGGMSSVIRKKKEMHVYPQIGHFFCNLVERRHSNSPDGDKDIDPLILNLIDVGQEMMVNLRHINLRPHPCYRDPEPINLYHKVGHGTLDMYVLSPSKDSREVREFMAKWNASDSKLFAGSHRKDSNSILFPVQNLVSICALLVWQPANPEDTITRILFPGSTPQHKIFEGFERLKHLEFLKRPVCTAKSISPSTSLATLKEKATILKPKLGSIERETKRLAEMRREKKELSENKAVKKDSAIDDTNAKTFAAKSAPSVQQKTESKAKKVVENKKIESESKESKLIENGIKDAKKEVKEVKKVEKSEETKKTDLVKIETEKTATVKESKTQKVETKKKEIKDVTKSTIKATRPDSTMKPSMKPPVDKKSKTTGEKKDIMKPSPTTPKKSINGAATKTEISKTATKSMKAASKTSSAVPAKSAKDANNRMVVEQKNIELSSKSSIDSKGKSKMTSTTSTIIERKPVTRRTKPLSPSKARLPISPAKSTKSTPSSIKSEKDAVIRKIKGGTTDSSAVSTPSGIDIESGNKLIDRNLTEKSEDMSLDSIESKVLADLKEEREVVEEIEAVLQKAERQEGTRKKFGRDDELTTETADKKDDDVTEEDVTAELDDAPKKISRKESQELTEEDEYLIVEKEEIYTEDSVQSGDTEQKHHLDEVESEKTKIHVEHATEESEHEEKDVDEKKDEIPEKKLVEPLINKEVRKSVDLSPENKEILEEEMKQIIASATEAVQQKEEKDDSARKDSEDLTKEPSSVSPEKFDSPGKQDVDQRESIPEKLEESQERISTLESGATTTAPTLPDDERVPLDEIKEELEKHVSEEVKEKELVKEKEILPDIPPITPKPEVKILDVKPPLQGIARDIVKTPDEVADLPVHEEVDPKLYRMDDIEKEKDIKVSPQETKEPTPPPKEKDKGVFSFFGKVADKFEKGIDKLTKKTRRDSEKDAEDKSSKSSSPKEPKPQSFDQVLLEETDMNKVFPKVGKHAETLNSLEKAKQEVSDAISGIDATTALLQEDIKDAQIDNFAFIELAQHIDKPLEILKKEIKREAVEDVEEVEALMEEASNKFKNVKDSLQDSLESLEDKIDGVKKVALEEKDEVKVMLTDVAEKLEDIADTDVKEPEKVKFTIPESEDFEGDDEDSGGVVRDFKEAVRDVAEVLVGTAGIEIEKGEKPKDVEEIVKKVAEVLKEDDFLSDKALLKSRPDEKEIMSDVDEKYALSKTVVEETTRGVKEQVEEFLRKESIETLSQPRKMSDVYDAIEEPFTKTVKEKEYMSSPTKDDLTDLEEAKMLCEDMLKGDIIKESTIELQADRQADVMDLGLEEVCVKKIAKREIYEEKNEDEDKIIVGPEISFQQNLSPGKAEIITVTPGSTPTSPKLAIDGEFSDLSSEYKDMINSGTNLENIIEEFIIQKKHKITMNIIEYIVIVKRVPKVKVINIIQEVIIKHKIPRERVTDRIEILRSSDDIPTETRTKIENDITNEYLDRNKKINSSIVDEIAQNNTISKRIVIEIIEEIIVKKRFPRESVFDISDESYFTIMKEDLDKVPEKIVQKQDVHVDVSSTIDTIDISTESIHMPTSAEEMDDKIVDGFVSISSKDTIETFLQQEKDSSQKDDFEAVEQEYKVQDVSTTSLKVTVEDQKSKDTEEVSESISDVMEVDEKFVRETIEKSTKKDDVSEGDDKAKDMKKVEEDTSHDIDISDVSEADTKEKYLDEAKEKPSEQIQLEKSVEPVNIAQSIVVSVVDHIKLLNEEKDTQEPVSVKRMVVTASSEDGGQETEICPSGTITFPKVPTLDDSKVDGGSADEIQRDIAHSPDSLQSGDISPAESVFSKSPTEKTSPHKLESVLLNEIAIGAASEKVFHNIEIDEGIVEKDAEHEKLISDIHSQSSLQDIVTDKSKTPSIENETSKADATPGKIIDTGRKEEYEDKVTSKSPNNEKEAHTTDDSHVKLVDDHHAQEHKDEVKEILTSSNVDKEVKAESLSDKIVKADQLKSQDIEIVSRTISSSVEKEALKEMLPEKLEDTVQIHEETISDKSKSLNVEKELLKEDSSEIKEESISDKSKSPSVEKESDKTVLPTKLDDDIQIKPQEIDIKHDSKSPSAERESVKEDCKQEKEEPISAKSKSLSVEKESVKEDPNKVKEESINDKSKSPSVEKENDKTVLPKQADDNAEVESQEIQIKDGSKSPSVEKEHEKGASPKKSDGMIQVEPKEIEIRHDSKSPSVERESTKEETSQAQEEKISDNLKSPSVEKEDSKAAPPKHADDSIQEKIPEIESKDGPKSPSVERESTKEETSQAQEEKISDNLKSPSVEKEDSKAAPPKHADDSIQEKIPEIESKDGPKSPSVERESTKEETSQAQEEKISDNLKSPSVEKEDSKAAPPKHADDSIQEKIPEIESKDGPKSPSVERESTKEETSQAQEEKISDNLKSLSGEKEDSKAAPPKDSDDSLQVKTQEIGSRGGSKSPSVERETTKEEMPANIVDTIQVQEEQMIDKSKSPSVEKEDSNAALPKQSDDSLQVKTQEIESKNGSKSPSVEKELATEEMPANIVDTNQVQEVQISNRSKSPSIEKDHKEALLTKSDESTEAQLQEHNIKEGSKSPSVEREVAKKDSSQENEELLIDRSKSPSVDKDDKVTSVKKFDDDLQVKSQEIDTKGGSKSPSVEKESAKDDGSTNSVGPSEVHLHDINQKDRSKSPSVEKETDKKEDISDKHVDNVTKIEDLSVKDRSKSPGAEKHMSETEKIQNLIGVESAVQEEHEVKDLSKSSCVIMKECSEERSIDLINVTLQEGEIKEKSRSVVDEKEIDKIDVKQHTIDFINFEKTKETTEKSKSPSIERDVSHGATRLEKYDSEDDRDLMTEASAIHTETRSKSPSVEKDAIRKDSVSKEGIYYEKEVFTDQFPLTKSLSSEQESANKESSPEKCIIDDKQSTANVTSQAADKSRSSSIITDTTEKETILENVTVSEELKKITSVSSVDDTKEKSKSPSVERDASRREDTPEKSVSEGDRGLMMEATFIHTETRSHSSSAEKDVSRKDSVSKKDIDDTKQLISDMTLSQFENISRSSSIIADVTKDSESSSKSRSGSIQSVIDHGVSLSSEKDKLKDTKSRTESISESVVSEARAHQSKSPSPEKIDVISEQYSDTFMEKARLSLVSDKFDEDSLDRTKSPSVLSDKSDEKDVIDRSKSPSVAGDKFDVGQIDDPIKEHIAEEKPSGSSLSEPHVVDKHDGEKSKSISPVGEEIHLESTGDRKISVTSVESHTEDKGKDRSRSHSLFDTGDKTPLVRSRAASLYDEKLVEKVTLLEHQKDSAGHSKGIFEEENEYRSSQETLDDIYKDLPRKDSKESDSPSAETKQAIENYILNEYIHKNKVITLACINEITTIYKVDRYVVIKIVNELITNLKLKQEQIVEIDEDEHDEAEQKLLDVEENLMNYINEEFVLKKKKINSKTIDEIASSKSVPRPLVILVIENIILSRNLRRESVVDFDLCESQDLLKKDMAADDLINKSKRKPSAEIVAEKAFVEDTTDISKSSRMSLESGPSVTTKSDKPEPRIDEEITISENKREEIESLIMDDYVDRGIKINEAILENIIVRTSVPKYIVIEIIQEIIVKKLLSKNMVVDEIIFSDDDLDEMPQKLGYEESSDSHHYEGHSLDKSMPYPEYESPFHKAFMEGMTEIRTTHITTLSGKSTPDLGQQEGIPESSSEVTSTITKTITCIPGKSEHETKDKGIGEFDEKDQTSDRVVILKTTQITTTCPDDEQEIITEFVQRQNLSGTVDMHKIEDEVESKSGTREIPSSIETTIEHDDGDHEFTEIVTTKIVKTIITETEMDPITKITKIASEIPSETTTTTTHSKIATESKSSHETIIPANVPESQIGSTSKTVVTCTIVDSGKSTPDIKLEEQISKSLTGKDLMDHTVAEQLEQSISPIIRDLISDDRSYSGKSSPDVSLPKDIAYGDSTGKSTPELSMSPLIRDGTMIQSHFSGRSTPDKRSENKSRTATPEGFRSGEVIRTIITTTRTISDDGEFITTTQEVTETTNEKGETVVLAAKTDVKVDEPATGIIMGDAFTADTQRASSPGSDLAEKEKDPTSPRSDLSSGHSRAATHMWESSEERHTYSDEDQSSPLFASSPHHQDQRVSIKEETSKPPVQTDFSTSAMSSSFYGQLPEELAHYTSTITKITESHPEQDFTFRKLTVEKEYAGGYAEKDTKKYVDEADLDFEKALTEAPGSSKELAKSSGDSKLGDLDDKKDPLAGWGSPLKLPSPKAPRKFNLRSPIQPTSSADLSPDSLNFDVINDWGEPMRLPSPAPAANEISNKGSPGTPKKEREQARKVMSENIKNKKRSESPSKNDKKYKNTKNKVQPVYVDLTYVSHHGNSFYTALDFFKKVRARYYVFSGTEPSREVYDALLEAKKTWEDKDLEVTLIPTYDTDTLGYWVADNEEALAANHIDLSPSASRCTINLQDHETSCSAYRLEF